MTFSRRAVHTAEPLLGKAKRTTTLLHHFCPFKSYQRNRPSGSGEAQEVEEPESEHLLHASQPERKGQDNLTWILASTRYRPSLPLAGSNTEAERDVCFPRVCG